jgi:hypothetical protein
MKRKRRKKAKANSFDVSSFESYSSFELDLEYVGDGGETYGEPGYAVEGATTVIVIEGNQSPALDGLEMQEGETPMDQEKVVVEEPVQEEEPEGTPRESPGDEEEPEQEPEEEEPEPEYDQQEEKPVEEVTYEQEVVVEEHVEGFCSNLRQAH